MAVSGPAYQREETIATCNTALPNIVVRQIVKRHSEHWVAISGIASNLDVFQRIQPMEIEPVRIFVGEAVKGIVSRAPA